MNGDPATVPIKIRPIARPCCKGITCRIIKVKISTSMKFAAKDFNKRLLSFKGSKNCLGKKTKPHR
jgi:hypothetical protein